MYNLNKDKIWSKVCSFNCDKQENLLLRYIMKYGSSGSQHRNLTPKKKFESLILYDYVSPNEYSLFKKNIKEPNPSEKQIINKYYIGTKLSWILNSKLRTGKELSEEEKKVFKILKELCYNNRCGKNYIFKRYVDLNFLSQYDITFDKFNETSAKNALNKIKNNLILNMDIVRTEKGFMSASYGKNGFFDREILLLLYTTCGIRMYVTDNDAETEIIFENGMRYIFIDSYVESVTDYGITFYRIVICCFLLGAD